MAYPLTAITGIGPAMTARLKALGIRTSEKLLEVSAKSPKARRALAEKLDVDEHLVLRWANLTDRMRIKGVREPYAELLKDAGVDTVRELKYRNPSRLAEAMCEANKKHKRVRLLPSERRVRRPLDPESRQARPEDHVLGRGFINAQKKRGLPAGAPALSAERQAQLWRAPVITAAAPIRIVTSALMIRLLSG